MKYQPGHVPEQTQGYKAWLVGELRRISNAIGPSEFLQIDPIDVEPAKPAQGMIAFAVGVNWNPGAGAGLYVYNGISWDKVN